MSADQTSRDEHLPARNSDPDTSKFAAAGIESKKVGEVILRLLKANPNGLTTEELAHLSGISLVTISPRLKPMESNGLVERRGTRPNQSGRQAIIWGIRSAQS